MQLTKQQLISARRLLKQAYDLTADAQHIFHRVGDADTSDRFQAIAERLAQEVAHLDAKISAVIQGSSGGVRS